jgi:small subunit ribosomal protein S20
VQERDEFNGAGLVFSAEMRYTQPFKGGESVPNIKSVKKDVIKSRKNHQRNIAAKSAMKTYIKKARLAVETPATDAAGTAEAVRLACKAIDKTAERGIIHKNQAARRKSRLMKRAHQAAQQASA